MSRVGVLHPHDDEDVLEMGADDSWGELATARLLKDDGHNVVTYMPFSQQLHGGKFRWEEGEGGGKEVRQKREKAGEDHAL